MAPNLQRLEHKRDALEKEWRLRSEKMSKIRVALAVETDVAQKFKLEQQLKDEEKSLSELGTELARVEEELKSSRSG